MNFCEFPNILKINLIYEKTKNVYLSMYNMNIKYVDNFSTQLWIMSITLWKT